MIRPVSTDRYMAREFDFATSNCWHLVRDVWRDMTGVDLGDLTPESVDPGSLNGAVDAAARGPMFARIGAPRQPCIVLMRQRKDPIPHVGVLLRWRLLHLTPRGVRHEWLSDVIRQWDELEYYVPAPEAE